MIALNKNNEGKQRMSEPWWAKGPADNARHVIGCHLTQETRVSAVEDDVAGITCQAMHHGDRAVLERASD